MLREADYPLVERVLLGPIEEEAKIFIMEKDKTHEVSSEVNDKKQMKDPRGVSMSQMQQTGHSNGVNMVPDLFVF